MLVVPDAFRNVQIRGFQQMVIDERTGVMDIVRDVQRKCWSCKKMASLVLMAG